MRSPDTLYHSLIEHTYHAVPGCPAGRRIPAELIQSGTAGRTEMCAACEARLEGHERSERATPLPWEQCIEPREAMVRPRYREWYPSLRADHWYGARDLAEQVLAQRRAGEWRWRAGARVLSDEHFLFRGSGPRGTAVGQTRSED